MAAPPEAEPKPQGLRKKTTRSIAWSLLGSVGTNVVRIISLAILGRLLAPHDFGIVATAMTVIVLVQSVRDIGVGGALIQRKNLTQPEIDSAFAFSTWLGLALTLVMLLAAPLIGAAFDQPRAVPLLRALSVMFALRGVSDRKSVV